MLERRAHPDVRSPGRISRRAVLIRAAAMATSIATLACQRRSAMLLVTFGDSILDCARYNEHGVTPGQLLVQNDDRLFPEFHGRDLQSRGPASLEHRARDGAT